MTLTVPPVIVDQVLPDRDCVTPALQRLDDQLAIRFARAGARRTRGRPARRVGDTVPTIAGFASVESEDTSTEMGGFATRSPGRPRPRTGIPAARK
jgi:hypothetical protein